MMKVAYSFSGKWITMPAFANVAPVNVFHRQTEDRMIQNKMPKNQHMLFRKRFTVQEGGCVKLYITADDYYKLYIGGQFVTQGPTPGFPFHYYYNEIDITDFVHAGENTLAVHVYYQGLKNRAWVSADDRTGLLFDVVQDGEVLAKSDDTVKCHKHSGFAELGIAGYQTQFLEQYDSRSPEVGFFKPEFEDSDWEEAAVKKYADYTLFPQPTKQLDLSFVQPACVDQIPGGYRIDFGRMYIGYLTAEAQGRAGEKVIIRCGQELNEDGSVRYQLRASTTYEEEWILSGREDTLSQYDYKSFRYAEFLCSDTCKIENIAMQIRHYPYQEKAVCRYEDPVLQKIWRLAADSLHYGVQDCIQDCMEREKGQYMGDGLFSSTTLAVLTGETAMMEKLIEEALRTSFINRGLMICSPCSMMQEGVDYPFMLPGFLLVHAFLTKSTAFAAACYDGVKDMMDYFTKTFAGEDGLLRDVDQWCVVDWPKEARDGYDFELHTSGPSWGLHNVVNAYYIGAVKAMNCLAGKIGREPYADAAPLEKAFLNVFYRKEEGLFCDAEKTEHISLPANAFALLFDLCPDQETEDRIIKMIMEKDASHSAFFVSFACLASFTRLGKEAELKAFIKNEGRWVRMLREGATSTFEAWGKDVKWNTSLFHLCYSFVALFLTDWGQDGYVREL
ncbi:MAG: family 78 glycoside hydrolase catalytic domain [Clostridia bacterium]|nr:family 78 glycoside hydrolase catalytic domain [Clostridia bacterium]